ncbi:MAG TPA: hypothetical protein VHZ55_18345, partial [Bryobacteraceae bacterium]|nr:hypothetical protein [Bryobacteraceae bacterium]
AVLQAQIDQIRDIHRHVRWRGEYLESGRSVPEARQGSQINNLENGKRNCGKTESIRFRTKNPD